MKKILFVLVMILILISCAPSDAAKNIGKKTEQEENKEITFVPPADGKITSEQIEKYVKVAKELTAEIENMSKIMESFKSKYKLTDDDVINIDKKDAKIKKEFEEIQKKWEDIESNIYIKYNLSQEEFEWIATALTEPVNSEAQKKVEEELSKK